MISDRAGTHRGCSNGWMYDHPAHKGAYVNTRTLGEGAWEQRGTDAELILLHGLCSLGMHHSAHMRMLRATSQ